MKVKFKVTGADKFKRALKAWEKETEEKIVKSVDTFTTNVRDSAKSNAQVDTGEMRREIKKRPLIRQIGYVKGEVVAGAKHSPFKEFGHLVKKGQLFFDKRSGTYKRVKATKWVKGRYYMTDAYTEHVKGFKRDLRRALIRK
ncbi:bacteriophage HK97-gp10, putative tail-component [Gottschalkia purinilytica]|uniref:Bacteriophage HK97-gp10, putative tail-component n=1 Tax=Gottschalkia purinilytica TaxID=1503 RepID=A0A0L0WCU7_GOTPU|nr:HK97 gp10 family phage protein [Gottschalkia purinilytica]KNF09304.1 bacteriophage HK97-gp10, putative tail-component [Gottschalkia purinilytica]